MSQLPPPPPGAEDNIPPPPGADAVPPPPSPATEPEIPPPVSEADQYEADLLKRRKHFSWKTFGGDGFLVSVAIHVAVLIIGLFWVISRYVAPPAKEDPDVFATGAGGGTGGEKPKAFEHKLKSRMTMVKSPARIVSKSASASVTLPTTPTTNTASFASGLSAGGMSKGVGGGSGGGEGTGIGIGKGGGRNFVSLFGARGPNVPGLPGTFYDIKLTKSGGESKYSAENTNNDYLNQILRPFLTNWDVNKLGNNFFKAPDNLVAAQLFIPVQSSGAAPKAYGVEDKCKPNRWICHYKGSVTAPKTSRFRFWVYADDVCVVRWNNKIYADNGWTTLGLPGVGGGNYAMEKSPFKEVDGSLRKQGKSNQIIFRPGPWFDTVKGREYPIEILMGDVGGLFGSYVLLEEAKPNSTEGDDKLFLFRMSADELPAELKDDTKLGVDLGGKELIWRAKAGKSGPVR